MDTQAIIINRKNMDYSTQMLMEKLISKLGKNLNSLPHTTHQINFKWLKI
jgi:hypothetical protein